MSLDYPEYDGYEADAHPDERDTLSRYRAAKSAFPMALVVLDEQPCGHLEVKIYNSEAEKRSFYRTKVDEMVSGLWKVVSR